MARTKPPETKEKELSLPPKEERELGFLLLGVVFGAVLGILGGLWVSFFVELLRDLIPSESWTLVSFLGLVIATILGIYTDKNSPNLYQITRGKRRIISELRESPLHSMLNLLSKKLLVYIGNGLVRSREM